MKRFAWIGVVLMVGGVFAVGAKGPGTGLCGGRGALVAEVLGMKAGVFHQAVRQKGLPALIREKGMDPLTFRKALLAARERRLEEALATGRIPKARYELLKRRLEAKKLVLDAPRWSEVLARAGADLKAVKAELKALRRREIKRLYELGLISAAQKGRMLAKLDRWVEGVLRRPALGGAGAEGIKGMRRGFKDRRPFPGRCQGHRDRGGAGPAQPKDHR